MKQLTKIEMFWQDYLSTLSEVDQTKTPTYIVDQFADTPEAATKVGKLVRDGARPQPVPSSGDWNISASRSQKWLKSISS